MDIGYSRSAREPQPAGDRWDRVRRNVDTVDSRRNGPLQLSMRHDDDDDDDNDDDDIKVTIYKSFSFTVTNFLIFRETLMESWKVVKQVVRTCNKLKVAQQVVVQQVEVMEFVN